MVVPALTMQSDGLLISGNRGVEAFVIDSNEALQFRLVRTKEDCAENLEKEDVCFHPEMSHQIYGDNENIFGYRGLRIDLWMSAASLKAFARIRTDETISGKQLDGISPDPVLPPLLKIFAPDQVTENFGDFISHLSSKSEVNFVPYGEKIDEFAVDVKPGAGLDDSGRKTMNFEIYKCDVLVPGFKDYHCRLQPWIMFYIDAASYIDDDDDNWIFFLLYEKYKSCEGLTRYAIAGYVTAYQYYAYPEHMRPRISQMLVLPPFQKKGLGAKLLDTVNHFFWNNPKVVDITVEDPSDDFIRLRDFVDVQNALKLLDSFSSLEKLKRGYNEAMVKEAREKMKLGKRQTRRVYEIIRLHRIKLNNPHGKDDPEYKAYRIDVKKRLNIPFQKQKYQLEKLKKTLNPEEFAAATISITNKEQRLESLEAQFNELMDHYNQVLERLNASLS